MPELARGLQYLFLAVGLHKLLKALNTILGSTPIDDLRSYLRWQVVHANATPPACPGRKGPCNCEGGTEFKLGGHVEADPSPR